MIPEMINSLLIPSLAGTALTAVICLFRPITKKVFGYSWHYYIWLCVLLTMLMPVRFNVKTAPVPRLAVPAVQTQQTTAVEQPETTETAPLQTGAAQKPQIFQKAAAVWNNRTDILAFLWLFGAAAFILLNIARYIRLNIKIRKYAKPISCPKIKEYTAQKVRVRVWENTASPFMTGMVRPTLILPKKELSEEQLHNILRHEMTHVKRHDILYKWFAEFVKCVHWFNPAAWYVSKQIAAECEISCDMAVTKNMTGSEEMSYVNTILSLLPTGKTTHLPLTTQMASSKKFLKRRFMMMKNKKTTSRLMSVLSAVLAVILLSTTVFASGALSDLTTDDYTIEIMSGGEKIELTNKPFIENGEVYVPLRELIDKSFSKDDGVTDIKWNDGTIDVTIAYYQGESGMYRLKIGSNLLGLKHISFDEHDKNFDEIENNAGVGMRLGLKQVPVLKNSTTYVPLINASYMLYSFTNRRDENKVPRELTYDVYDKNGNIIDYSGFYHIVIGEYTIKIPESWSGKYSVEMASDMVSFVQKAAYDKYGIGTLFRIEKTNAENADEILNMLGGSRLLYKDDTYAYIFEVPTDVQYPIWIDRDEEDVEIAAEYEEMFKDVFNIADSFEFLSAANRKKGV